MRMEVHRNSYYLCHDLGFRLWLGKSRNEALEALPAARVKARNMADELKSKPKGRADPWIRVRNVLYSSMKKRAGERGDGLMPKEDFYALWARAAGKCEVTGIRFRLARLPGRAKRPWAPSVDRRNPKLGYALDNCRLVCTAVNLAMNEWGEDTLREIARALLAR